MATSKTAIAKAKNTMPVDMEAQMAAEIATFNQRLQVHGGNKIDVKGKVFTLPDGSSAPEINVIIIDFINTNTFYEKGYVKGVSVPPNCFAISVESAGMIPSDNSPDKQCEDCGTCWANAWKSSPTGDGKACKNERQLVVMAPDGGPDTALLTLNASPTALKAFDSYVASVARTFQRPPRGVVTTITFDPNSDYPSLRFGNPVPCTKEQLAEAWGRKEEAQAILLQEPDVSGFVKAAPAKGKAPVRRAA